MTELRLDRELYDQAAVDEAVRVYERFGSLERADEPGWWVVRVAGRDTVRERRLVNELANHALGRTIERASRAAGDGATASITGGGA